MKPTIPVRANCPSLFLSNKRASPIVVALGRSVFLCALIAAGDVITLDPSSVCSFEGKPPPAQVAIDYWDSSPALPLDALHTIGLAPNFSFAYAGVSTALAVIHEKKRVILSNKNIFFETAGIKEMNTLRPSAGVQNYRSLMDNYERNELPWRMQRQGQKGELHSIIAQMHEMGHHLNGHTLEGGGKKRWQFELEADRFAGHLAVKYFVLGSGRNHRIFVVYGENVRTSDGTDPHAIEKTTGGSIGVWTDPDTGERAEVRFDVEFHQWVRPLALEHAKGAISAFAGDRGSATHPPKTDRLKAFEEGWLSALDEN